MATCKSCGKVVSVLDMVDGLCKECQSPDVFNEIALKKEREAELAANANAVNSIMLTTEMAIADQVETRLGMVTAQRIYGINIIKDLFSFVRDIVGGRINSLERALSDANRDIHKELREKAYLAGADAVIAVKIEHTYNNSNAGSILSVFATGTMVKLKNDS
ncbi:YbjQ family protein [Sulfurimonas sp. ST-25]|uniref:YbjQ family protein n=1 Tax=Sulfurimonas sp. ST-25 TaxID=3400151 RepID=UPI003A8911D3